MSNRKANPEHDQAEPAETGGEEREDNAAPEAAEAEDEAARTARLEAEVAELRDQLLRALAEGENQRRRGQREREEAVRYAAAPMLRELVPVADNLQRALESVPPDAAERDDTLRTLLEGVQLTQRELQAVFERHGIVRLDPMGERLNPHHHEAMFEVPDPSQPSGTVVQVIQPGYLLHDRLLRAAQVGVAKGGPPASSGPEEAAPEDSATNGSGNPDPGTHVDTSA